MTNAVKKWIHGDGKAFLRKLGIQKGDIVVDFGSGAGHYAIPAAKVVSTEGKVYAIEKDKHAIKKLMHTADEEGLREIIQSMSPESENPMRIGLADETVDVALIYDVLHYFTKSERQRIYKEIYRILKFGGLLSAYPKHSKLDWPLWNLAEMDVADVVQEITAQKFGFEKKERVELLHDEGYEKGDILIFKKRANYL